MPKEIKAHSPLVHRTTQWLRIDYDTIRFLTGNWRETACSYDCKRQWNLLQNCKCYIKLDSVISKKKKDQIKDFGLVNNRNIFVNARGQVWTRMVQWWEHSPATNEARVPMLAWTPYMGWLCCWSFFMALRGFSPGTPVFPSPQKPTFPNSNSTRYQEDKERPSGYAASKSLLIEWFNIQIRTQHCFSIFNFLVQTV